MEFRRILLIKPSSLGDLVHALPVLHGLRQRFPDAHIAWLVSSRFAPLLRNHPELDEVIEFDRDHFSRLGRSLVVTRGFARFVKELRGRRFDLAVDLQGLFRSGFLAWASGASIRVGFRSAREMAWIFYTQHVGTPDEELHAVEKNYLVSRALGFEDVPVTFELGLTRSERMRAVEILASGGINPGRPFAAALPGARWDTKRWMPERYAAAIERLAESHGLRTVLMGSSSEAELCARITDLAGNSGSPANIAGRTSLRETVAILERAAVVVCQDSAPAHLASALGRPIVCILGPTNRHRTGPHTTDARILQADLPCVPCYFRSLFQCPYSHECMRQVEVDDVVEATLAALGEPTPAQK